MRSAIDSYFADISRKHPTIHFCLLESLMLPQWEKVTFLKICAKKILFIEKWQN
jgi:hypothetical protein